MDFMFYLEDDEAVEGGQYECDRPGCTKAYDTDKKLRKHIRHHEVIEEGRTICSECQRRFCSKQALKRHLSSTEHLQNVRRKGKGSSSQAGDPDADDEAVEGGQYECDRPGCTKAYDTDKKLRKHIRQHEVIEEGKTICPKCQRRFSSRANLRRHQESTGHFQAPSPPREPKKFQCPECDRSYDRKSTLKEHLKSHEGKADCPYCPESFGRPATMYNHVSKKHPDKPNPRDPRKSN
ncbi:unnamed protein product [Bemisia tabaci]|uniref:C2H2-type domain-containing protein n=1 Tax=Bemisia tabaci TaxID=7038 RepID=A0A9P0AN56_BEMTA|nr:unnamed protein product [Bemisia tabaci]